MFQLSKLAMIHIFQAMDKGATPFAIGMIIGAAPLSVTVLSPVIGMVVSS